MSENPLDKLGELLMTRVRDKAIGDWDRILDGRMKGATAERARAELAADGGDHGAILHRLIPRIVDTTLHHLLWTLEQERSLNLAVDAEGAVVSSVREASDGLSGELYGRRGWIVRYSGERHEEG
jgi:hypothetical protein